MSPLPQLLSARLADSGGQLTLDGGLATELGRAGCDLNHPLWSARVLLTNPAAIVMATRAFAEAGADIVATATYQATFEGLERMGVDRANAEQFFHKAVDLAREAAVTAGRDRPPLVAASIGPYGAFLADGSEYCGNYGLTIPELARFHRDRLAVLVETGADVMGFETFPSAVEARAVADLLTEFPTAEAWISFSCRDGQHLWDGSTIEEIAEDLEDHPQITAIGVNCVDPGHAVELISRLRDAAPDKAVIAYPNAGRGWNAETGDWRGIDTPEDFSRRALAWREAGASIIGGCCQTTPDHIRALAESTIGSLVGQS
ncbi:MAG: homocysteine S-methyltransferase [Verrucomicrobiae bacterium]|nr:homocysteine S-methyltransferase [Verrucomicrobiae bacterium]